MPELIQLVGADGRPIQVDAERYRQFNSLSGDIRNALGAGGPFQTVGDAEPVSFLVSQLAYTEQQVFERMYQPMQYEQLVPISFEAGEWADTIEYEIYDYVGRGKKTSGKGKDINLVDVAYGRKKMPVEYGNIGYDYSSEELRRSAYLRKPLNTTRLEAAMEGYRRHMNDVALNGESSSNIQGLFNSSLVPSGNAPVGAWTTGPKTPAQILNDINSGIMNVWTNTAYNDHVTDVVMAPTAFQYVASTPRSDNSDKTILQYIKENNIAKVERNIDINFTAGYGLDTAGAGGTKRAVFYVKSPTRVIMHIPLPLRFLAPQPNGLAVEVPGEYKYSGTTFRYPKSAYYMDGL